MGGVTVVTCAGSWAACVGQKKYLRFVSSHRIESTNYMYFFRKCHLFLCISYV